jgi:hypothetical protein
MTIATFDKYLKLKGQNPIVNLLKFYYSLPISIEDFFKKKVWHDFTSFLGKEHKIP